MGPHEVNYSILGSILGSSFYGSYQIIFRKAPLGSLKPTDRVQGLGVILNPRPRYSVLSFAFLNSIIV